jgi:hypothetical protein
MAMTKPRYFLVLAIFVLAIGCFLLLGGTAIKPAEWPMYLGMTCLILAICVAALIEALQVQLKRIEELERKLSEKQSPAEPNAAADGGVPGS